MGIGVLGTPAEKGLVQLHSLEGAKEAVNTGKIDILIIGGQFPSCDFTRDIVITGNNILYEEFKKLNPDIKIIFMKRKDEYYEGL